MRVFVLKVYDESCGEDSVYVCKSREKVKDEIREKASRYEEYGSDGELDKCLKDVLELNGGQFQSLYFELYETEMDED